MRNNWKKTLTEVLKELEIIRLDMTGKIVINLNQGGITDIERRERLK